MVEGLTKGKSRVRVSFNPSEDTFVAVLKEETAKLIDRLEDLKEPEAEVGEFKRLIALAQTAYEEACMWAVKARTLHTKYPTNGVEESENS